MAIETFYEVIRRQGISRRSFLKFISLTTASLGLPPMFAPRMARAFEEKPRVPVLWLHGLECTCCSESFIRSGHPLASDVVLSMISLDYDDTIMAAAGHQAEKCLDDVRAEYPGQYVVAVEGNPPLADDGTYCMVGGRPFLEQLREVCSDAMAVISWGSCASWGCVQAARPNPTRATPVHKVITDKPVIKVPGCPPIAEVMTGVLSYIVAFDRLPELDSRGRPSMFYGNRIHDRCYRRPHFDAGQFVEQWDDQAARDGYCLYKVGCRGPTTYSPCATTRWNGGISFPIQSGHGCIGCTEDGFWDDGPFYDRLATVGAFGIDQNADVVGAYTAGAVGAGIAVHAAVSAVKRARQKREEAEAKEAAAKAMTAKAEVEPDTETSAPSEGDGSTSGGRADGEGSGPIADGEAEDAGTDELRESKTTTDADADAATDAADGEEDTEDDATEEDGDEDAEDEDADEEKDR